MLAFNLLMALLPMTIILFGTLGLILGNNVHLQTRLADRIINALPPKANEGLREIVQMAFDKLYRDAGWIVTFGIFFAIFGASRLFVAIDRCLTIIYRVEERPFVKKYISAAKMILVFLILIPLMILASSAPSFLLDVISNVGGRVGTYLLGLVSGLAVSFLLFEIIYLMIPNRKMTFQQTWRGSLIAATALQLFMILFPLYVRKSLTSYTGQVGLAIILLLFLFYFAIILILGAQINAFFVEHIQAFPVPLGSLISQFVSHGSGKVSDNP